MAPGVAGRGEETKRGRRASDVPVNGIGDGAREYSQIVLLDTDLTFDPDGQYPLAAKAEADGYAGLWAAEVGHDPLLILAGAATATTRIELGTGIVVAFGRSPMITATLANDVQRLSRGRLLLGLGSQIKPHIEKRYSMPWSHPAPRMREYIVAMRAIWSSWNDGAPLNFRGEYYRHTLMTPFFSPAPHEFGAPKIMLAAVGELMTEVAGEVADGLLVHPFTTERYLREVTLPALERGLSRSQRSRDDFQISYSGLIASGGDDVARRDAETAVRAQIAFYASTPAYRGVLALHGWAQLQPALALLARRGEWAAMGDLISEEVLHTVAIVGAPSEVAPALKARFGDVVDRFSIYAPSGMTDDVRRSIARGLQLTVD